jgi:hypothetical protein
MKIATGLLLLASACGIAFVAQASEAEPPSATATPAQPTDATATTPAANATAQKKVTKVVLVDNEVNDAQLKQILAQGYRPEGHGEKVLYCRSEAEVGTRFKTKTCRTSTRILQDEAAGKDMGRNTQKDMGNPTGK